ncbi:hypothetical protein AI2638V1_5110, partial (plasmid) [Klebsiella pneumoniae]
VGEVEAGAIWMLYLKTSEYSECLRIALVAAEVLSNLVKLFFAGVAERRVANIVRKRSQFGYNVMFKFKFGCDASGNLGDFQAMSQSVTVKFLRIDFKQLHLSL